MNNIRFTAVALLPLLLSPAPVPAQSRIPRQRLADIKQASARDAVDKFYSEDPFERAQGASQLRALGPRAQPAVPWLIEALGDDEYEGDWDPSERVSWYAHWALVAVGDGAVDPLIESLNCRDILVRERAAKLLGEMKVPNAAKPLLAVLDRADVKQAWGTARALGELKVKTAVEPLIKLLEWEDWKTRQQAAWALASIGDERAIEPLQELAVRDTGTDVAESAVGALAELSDSGMDAAVALLRHEKSATRQSAARSLAYVRDTRLIEPLLMAIDDPSIQATAAQSLHWIVEHRGIDVALDAYSMKNAVQEVRRVALVEISRSDHPEKVGLLIEGLADSGDDVQWFAVRALGQLKAPEALEPLIEVMKTSGNNGVRADAAEALGEIGDPRAFDALHEALGDETSLVRAAVAKALGNLGDTRAIPALLRLIGDDGFDSRRYAAYALAKFDDPRVAPALIRLLTGHESSTTRTDAAWALGNVDAPGVIESLAKSLKDEDPHVRQASIASLARLNDPRTAEVLRATLYPTAAEQALDAIRKAVARSTASPSRSPAGTSNNGTP